MYLVVLIAIFTSPLYAETLYLKNSNKADTNLHFMEVYTEDEFTKVDYFIVQKEKLQERVMSKTFSSQSDAYNFLIKFKSKYNLQEAEGFTDNLFMKLVNTELTNKQVVWATKNEWSQKWEDEFSLWVKSNFTKDFFIKYKIETDCADVAFALRWIFSRINFLPAANSLAASGVLFSNESMKLEWKNLPTHEQWNLDIRFLAALKYMLNNTYTKSLAKDTYPIKIDHQNFNPGTIQLLGSHTLVLSSMNFDNTGIPFVMLSSTIPAKIRELSESFISNTNDIDPKSGGIVKMRWPIKIGEKYQLKEKIDMPNYSMEQYGKDFVNETGDFILTVIKRVHPEFKVESLIKNLVNNLSKLIESRISVVAEGFNYCKKNSCAEGTTGYEEWSTPSRDQRILETYNSIEEIINTMSGSLSYEYLHKLFHKNLDNKIHVLGESFSIKELITKFSNNWPSYHPSDSQEQRWGISNQDVENYIREHYQRLSLNRIKKIDSAQECRLKPNMCGFNTDLWKAWNTFELDHKIKKLYKAYVSLCHNITNYQCRSENFENIYKIPFLIANPIYSINVRSAKDIKSEQVIIFPDASNCQVIDEEFAICNRNNLYGFVNDTRNYLYSLKQRRFIKLKKDYENINYISQLDIIIAATDNAFYEIDLSSGDEKLLLEVKSEFHPNLTSTSLTVNGYLCLTAKNDNQEYYHSYFKTINGNLSFVTESIPHLDINLQLLEGALIKDESGMMQFWDFITGEHANIATHDEDFYLHPYYFLGEKYSIQGFKLNKKSIYYHFNLISKEIIKMEDNLSLGDIFPSELGYASISHKENEAYFTNLTSEFKIINSFYLGNKNDFQSAKLDKINFLIGNLYSQDKAVTEFYIYNRSKLEKIPNPVENSNISSFAGDWIALKPIDKNSKVRYLYNWKTKNTKKIFNDSVQLFPSFSRKNTLLSISNTSIDANRITNNFEEYYILNSEGETGILSTSLNNLGFSTILQDEHIIRDEHIYQISVIDNISLLYLPNK